MGWDISKEKGFITAMAGKGGDSWCLTMYMAAKLITKVECENVKIRCKSSDVVGLMKDHPWEAYVAPAKECLKKQCHAELANPVRTMPSMFSNVLNSKPELLVDFPNKSTIWNKDGFW